MLRHSCILGDPQRQAQRAELGVVPNKGKRNQKWLFPSFASRFFRKQPLGGGFFLGAKFF